MAGESTGLFCDLYELTMARAYLREGLLGTAVFDLFVRRLPPRRNYLVACGQGDALAAIESFRFGPDAIGYLRSLGLFDEEFLSWLRGFHFLGQVRAVPEGTVVFAGEPIMEVEAPLPEAQVLETVVLNVVQFETLVASKASRVVAAAGGRPVVDFGMRRLHGADAAVLAARASYVAGVGATSNLLAGLRHGIPVSGTMAHSYVQAHEQEIDAFRSFTRTYPQATLLVDTYDTQSGVMNVVRLARELPADLRPAAIRIDSGDLSGLAREARKVLDEAGLRDVRIIASGDLDEDVIARLGPDAPIDAFGVGTRMGVSADMPMLDAVYKLVAYEGRGVVKLSAGKETWPGAKQVFRDMTGGVAAGDVIACRDEVLPGEPLLRTVMSGGVRTPAGQAPLADARARAAREVASLPAAVRGLDPARPGYLVRRSPGLDAARDLAAAGAGRR